MEIEKRTGVLFYSPILPFLGGGGGARGKTENAPWIDSGSTMPKQEVWKELPTKLHSIVRLL